MRKIGVKFMAKKEKDKNKISKITIYKIGRDFPIKKALSEYKELNNGKGVLSEWNYRIFVRSRFNISPAWQPLVANIISENEIPKNSYASLVIIFNKDDNYFALTAGYGYANVREYAIDDFGIDIARKSLDPNKLDHLYQKIPTGYVYGLNRRLRGKYMPINDPINHRSVLKALRGKVINQEIGATMEGGKSLAISGKKDLSAVILLLDKIIAIEKSDRITVNIKGLDEVSRDLNGKLDHELIEKINNSKLDNVLFGYDDDLVFNNCESLKIGRDETLYSIDDIEKAMEAAIQQKSEEPALVSVTGLDDQEQEIFERKLIDLIEGELDYQDNKYFRINKKWYKTNQEYKKQIEDDFKGISQITTDYFQPWSKKNEKYVDENIFLKANIGGEKILAHEKRISHIEFADIIDKQKNYLIHVKKGKGAYLRNLFAQGYVSASLFKGEDDSKNKVKNTFSIDINEKFTVVFAIFPEEEKKIDSIFTLFAKVDLLERHDSLKEMGYDVKYYLING